MSPICVAKNIDKTLVLDYYFFWYGIEILILSIVGTNKKFLKFLVLGEKKSDINLNTKKMNFAQILVYCTSSNDNQKVAFDTFV
jgi:hypothetical protein